MTTCSPCFKLLVFISVYILTVSLSNNLYAQAGTLDLSFGDSGKVVTDENSNSAIENSIAIQPDQKIIIGASLDSLNKTFSTIIRQYDANGFVDSSFGLNGKVKIDSIELYDIKLTSEGKILVYGSPRAYIFSIMQLNNNGTIDSNFGYKGKVSFSLNFTSSYGGAGAISILNNGDILATIPTLGVIKLKKNGLIDSSFGSDGITTTNGTVGSGLNTAEQETSSVFVQADNKILVGGAISSNGMYFKFVMVRYTLNGVLDSTYGSNGRIISTYEQDTATDSSANTLVKIGMQSNGKIVAGGIYHNYTTKKSEFALVRFNSEGAFDSSFGFNGKFIINGFSSAELNSILIQNDDKIVCVGALYNNTSQFGLARSLSNGNIDLSFGNNGYTATSFDGSAVALASAFQGDKIIVLGGVYLNNEEYIALARYNADAVLAISKLSFSGIKEQNSIVLNWQTTNENNNDHFILERTSNNSFTNWNQLVIIKTKGNSAATQSYSYEDIQPLQGNNYYRLKQVDKDGKFTYSNIVTVEFTTGLFSAAPNPASNIINLTVPQSNNASTIILYDAEGRSVLSQHLSPNITTKQIDISKLAAGFYTIILIQNGNRQTVKVVKK